MAQDMKSPVFIARVGTILISIILMGVGLHSHFESAWKEYDLHKICPKDLVTCPHIGMESFYVSMVIIFFILSLCLLVGSFLADLKSSPLKTVDLGYHGIGALLLLLAGILYLVSAVQINKIVIGSAMRYEEKLAAGAIAIIQALLFGVVAMLISKQ